ncbi:hypothetical protein ATCC90586_009986 [Pythium insidiosum]|nr:hypothetical protein ATCC90586_009986 [Pythium insidiosum]
MVFLSVQSVLALTSLAAISVAAQEVKVSTYGFDGTTLTGAINVQNLAFQKVVNVIYANKNHQWGSSCGAVYKSGPDASNKEVWSFSCPIGAAGVSEFFVEYKANGNTFYDNNGGAGINYPVGSPTAPTTAPPTAPPTPVPNAGFQADINAYFSSGVPTFKQLLLANISPKSIPRALPGSIIAATASDANNYIYHWIRDAALVMDVVNSFYKAGDKSVEQTFWDHAAFTKKLQGLQTQTGLGEAKYNVDGTAYNEPWCRPQNDGPALRASSFIRFAKQYLANGGSLARVVELYNGTSGGVIKPDLEYTTRNYNDAGNCDLWEEVRGVHFFTVAAQRKAMHEGRDFARFLGDEGAAAFYAQQAANLDARIKSFWNAGAQSIQTTLNGRLLDAAIPLGVVHGDLNDGLFSASDDRTLSSIYSLEDGFIREYTLNQRVKTDATGLPLSVAIGRYYGDVYDGSSMPMPGKTLGNPWYLCTAIVAETTYRAATAFIKAGSIKVTALNQRLFNGPQPAGLGLNVAQGTYASTSPEFKRIVSELTTYGDKHIRRIKFHGAANFHLNEQYNRDTGFAQGVNDLTWSYAAMLSANAAREELKALSA